MQNQTIFRLKLLEMHVFCYILTKNILTKAKKTITILHPLPRVNEIEKNVDELPNAAYFEQAGNGIPIRQAILTLVAGVFS